MNKQALKELIAANTGKTAQEIFDLLPAAETKIGRIQGDNKLDLLTLVLANDMEDRLAADFVKTNEEINAGQETPLSDEVCDTYRAVAKSLHHALNPHLLMSDLYRINLGVSDVAALMQGAEYFGLVTPTEAIKINTLATYTIDDFAGVTVTDIENILLEVPTQATAIGYPVFDTASPWYAQGSSARTQVSIVCYEVLPADAVFTVTAHPDTTGNKEFADVGFKVRDVRLTEGAKSTVVRMTDKFPQYTQFKVECNLNVAFTASFKAI